MRALTASSLDLERAGLWAGAVVSLELALAIVLVLVLVEPLARRGVAIDVYWFDVQGGLCEVRFLNYLGAQKGGRTELEMLWTGRRNVLPGWGIGT
jgi:hypothetical protein